jgi:hypothetical protein
MLRRRSSARTSAFQQQSNASGSDPSQRLTHETVSTSASTAAGTTIRGRLGVEIARAYHQHRDYPATLHWLETAYATSHDSVQYSPTARQMAADTVDHGGPLISRGARSLAGSISLPL